MKKELIFQEDRYNHFVAILNEFAEILPAAIKELKSQGVAGVRGLTFERIIDGQFTRFFEEYHKAQQKKSDVTKNMLYEKFLDLYGYSMEELQRLENNYMAYLNREFSFYEINNSFYENAQSIWTQNAALIPFGDNPPKKKDYKVFDFVKINASTIKIEVPKELYTLYATNQRQLETIDKVKRYVGLAKELDIPYKDIVEPLKRFLRHNSNPFSGIGMEGLSRDLNTINFDYEKILTIQ